MGNPLKIKNFITYLLTKNGTLRTNVLRPLYIDEILFFFLMIESSSSSLVQLDLAV